MSLNTAETAQEANERLDRNRQKGGLFGADVQSVHQQEVADDLVFDGETLSESDVIARELLEDEAMAAAGLTPAWAPPAAPDLSAPSVTPSRGRVTLETTPELIQKYGQGTGVAAAAATYVSAVTVGPTITPAAAANPDLMQVPVWSTAPAAPLFEPVSDAEFWGPPSAAQVAESKAEGERLMEAYRNRDDSDDEVNAYPAAKLAPAPTVTPAPAGKKRRWFSFLRK